MPGTCVIQNWLKIFVQHGTKVCLECGRYSLPANTKSDAVYLVADVIDELCKRMLNFISSCCSDSDLIRYVVKHGVDARMNSPLGRNGVFWSLRYRVPVHDLCTLPLPNSFWGAFFYVSKCRICTQSTLCVRVDNVTREYYFYRYLVCS